MSSPEGEIKKEKVSFSLSPLEHAEVKEEKENVDFLITNNLQPDIDETKEEEPPQKGIEEEQNEIEKVLNENNISNSLIFSIPQKETEELPPQESQEKADESSEESDEEDVRELEGRTVSSKGFEVCSCFLL